MASTIPTSAPREANGCISSHHRQDYGLVFCTGVGTPIHPRNLIRSFHALLRRAAMPRIRFHDLRHSCLSLLAAQGVPARVAMDIAGHSDIRLTLSVYTHVYDEAKQQAADAMDRLFPAALEAGDYRPRGVWLHTWLHPANEGAARNRPPPRFWHYN